MSRPKRWVREKFANGFQVYRLSSWKYYSDFISQEMLHFINYVYRGHGDSSWNLRPTLDRIVNSPVSSIREKHLERFKFETRGRRGSNPPVLENENDWWALGQHHGLATPLLDWTESPFVALYFAATNAKNNKSKDCAVFALSQRAIHEKNKLINENSNVGMVNGRKPTVKIVKPLSDENSRLVSQRGLFTRGPNNVNLEDWIQSYPLASSGRKMELIKIIIPSLDIDNCIKYLNRMNISHSTLFPDLSGASDFCNLHLSIHNY